MQAVVFLNDSPHGKQSRETSSRPGTRGEKEKRNTVSTFSAGSEGSSYIYP